MVQEYFNQSALYLGPFYIVVISINSILIIMLFIMQYFKKVNANQGIKFIWNYPGHQVFLTGNWLHWNEKIQLKQINQQFEVQLKLPPGTYYYKYIVDGKWKINPQQQIVLDHSFNQNNIIKIDI